MMGHRHTQKQRRRTVQDTLRPGPAVDCEFDGIVPADLEQSEGETCPACGGHAPPVEVKDCPSPDYCEDDDHHFGLGVHVVAEVES
jgi:hypothetical protein